MSEVTATDAPRRFADLLIAVRVVPLTSQQLSWCGSMAGAEADEVEVVELEVRVVHALAPRDTVEEHI